MGSAGQTFSDSKFYSNNNFKVLLDRNLIFNNTEFVVTGKGVSGTARDLGFMVGWSNSYTSLRDAAVTFNNCNFRTGDGIESADNTYAIKMSADGKDTNNILHINGGSIGRDFDYGLFVSQGGSMIAKNVKIEASQPVRWGGFMSGWGTPYYSNVSLNDLNIQSNNYLYMASNDANNIFDQQNIQIDNSANKISSYYSSIANNNFIGHRVILGDVPPTSSTHCFVGDIYRLKNPTGGQNYKWQCTAPAFNTNTGAVWTQISKAWIGAVSLSNTPSDQTSQTSASIAVSGTAITNYKYKLDEGSYSGENSISTPINLSGLALGNHSVWVIGRNSAGTWQDEDDATVYRWTVDNDPPAGIVRINGGDTMSDTSNITLTFDTTDANPVTKMRISNIPDFNSAQEFDYAASKSWALNSGKGIQVVYVWFKDALGNWTDSASPVKDTIYSTNSAPTPPPPAPIAADLNSDNLVNQTDFDILKADFLKLAGSLTNPKSDIDGDGQATIKDVGIMMSGWNPY